MWIGEGSVSFDPSLDQMFFSTIWKIGPLENQRIQCSQQVKMEEIDETLENSYIIYLKDDSSFDLELENDSLGKVWGAGLIDEKTIAWELFGETAVQGYEIYEIQEDGNYHFHAEYASPNQFRTLIEGHIRGLFREST
jgi:hypothetical protein